MLQTGLWPISYLLILKKTNYIIFKNNTPDDKKIPIMLSNCQLEQVMFTKFLGITIDSDLTWKNHIKDIERKISSVIGVISKIRFKINTKTCAKLYDALILSRLTYCNVIWASTHKTSLTKLFILQKRALRICYRLNKSTGNNMFKQLNKLSIYDLNKLYKIKFVYSVLNNLLPKCFNGFFIRNSTMYIYNTRHPNKLFICPVSTTLRKLFVVNSAPILWNELPDSITFSNSLPMLSSAYKKYLLQSV